MSLLEVSLFLLVYHRSCARRKSICFLAYFLPSLFFYFLFCLSIATRNLIRIRFFFFLFLFLNIFFFLYFFFLHWFGSIQRRFYDDHSKCKTCGCLPVTKYKSPLCIPCFYHFKIRIITRIITYIYPINFTCLAGIEEIVNRVYLAQIYLFVQDI